MPKTQITYVYASNLKSRSNEFKHGKVIIPIPGDITPNKDGITDTKSILQALDLLGSAGMFIFMGIISQPFPDPTLRCVDGKGRIYEEGATAPGSSCVKCRDGIWKHRADTDPCPGWHATQFGCSEDPFEPCHKCGPCLSCLAKDGEDEENGEYKCVDDWTPEDLEEQLDECKRCNNSVKCGKESPWDYYCDDIGLSCCYGVCYNPNTQCTYTNDEGNCRVGCPDGKICVDFGHLEVFHGRYLRLECVDDPDYTPSLALKDNLIP
tara:strand:+ start:2300 stop:3094 length:795 start_codon:yes stop_codon:yes gene_type:complete